MVAAKVRDYMSKEVVAVPETVTVGTARNLMLERKIKRLVVVDGGGRAVGVITSTDLARALAKRGAPWKWRNPENSLVSRFMTRDPVCISPDASLEEAGRIMLERGISGLPVIRDGRVIGVITKTDVVRYFAESMAGRYRVQDLMTREVVTARETHSVKRIARIMIKKGIGRVVVVDSGMRILGIVTKTDVANVSGQFREKTVVIDTDVGRASREIRAKTAGEVMSNPVVTIRPDADAAKAARMMIEWGFSGLPVSPDGERLAGIITKTDIVRGLVMAGES